jgi:hypothetical protein
MTSMQDIVLTPEQTSILNGTFKPLTVVDANGFVVGRVIQGHFTKKQIEEAERIRNSDGPWYTTKEVLTHLKSLEVQ